MQAEQKGKPGGNFAVNLDKYQHWRDDLVAAISEYQAWVEQQEFVDGEQDLRIYELIENLKADKLTVALVGEFSRGKTELLNALFFSDFKQRLLPSSSGMTTMCPTELRYDEKVGICIKLLPIETRKTSITVSEYKNTPIHWMTLHILKPGSLEEIREALTEITKTKKVSIYEAKELGLYNPESEEQKTDVKELVEVPRWRHAIINYPHPLLKQGMVIIDTPGLNAISSEPELTLNVLPSANAIIFVLSCDTGVTRTDMELWRKHISEVADPKHNKCIVVLNKTDILWENAAHEDNSREMIQKQVDETAKILKIDRNLIFPVSAKYGFIGKINNEQTLNSKSGLATLEEKLAREILPSKHEIIKRQVVFEINDRVSNSRAVLKSKLTAINKQLSDLKNLGSKRLEDIKVLATQMRKEKERYDKEVEGYKIVKKTLSEKARVLLSFLDIKSLDQLIKETRKSMHESWTTRGLQAGMKTFFDGAIERMNRVDAQANEIRNLIDGIYKRLHSEYGLPEIKPPKLPLIDHFVELKNLEKKAANFRTSPTMVLTEQAFVIKKFFITMVSTARNIFAHCTHSALNWFDTALKTVFNQINQHKAEISQELEKLKKVHENLDSLSAHIADKREIKQDLENQLKTIDRLFNRIHEPNE